MAKDELANSQVGSKNFIDRVYHQGLETLVRGATGWIKGTFGHTKLSCISVDGSAFLQFECDAEDFPTGEPNHPWAKGRNYIGFIVSDDGEGEDALYVTVLGFRGDLPPRMFKEVVDHWPQEPEAQVACFIRDGSCREEE